MSITPPGRAPSAITQGELSLRTRQLYDNLAPNYDRHLLHECRYATPREAVSLLEEQGAEARGLWLDLGAGTGLVGRELATREMALDLVAVDLSRRMLEQIVAPAYVACCHSDVSDGIPFAEQQFDGAFAIGFFDHILDPANVLLELSRTLRARAPLVLSFGESAGADVELFDAEAGILLHSRGFIHRSLQRAGWRVTGERVIDGYESYGEKMVHRILVARSGPNT